ncbi:MAG TPA: O-methyltransferase [Phycisphaerae bacterium]|jgi:predicted O-methyltransferase YrrM
MNQEKWSAVDDYLNSHCILSDEPLEHALQTSRAANLPPISVTPAQGKFLHVTALAMNAKKILEIGTLGAYSTIWLARALPDNGTVTTLEYNTKHADIARANLAHAGLSHKVDLRLGRALDLLPQLQSSAPFDLFFIDADKENNAHYFAWALKLARKGSLIIVDNVVRKGAITDPNSADPDVQGTQKFFQALSKEPRVTATTLQTVGAKGYDGMTLAVVL